MGPSPGVYPGLWASARGTSAKAQRRKGYNAIRVSMRVETDAAPEVIRELAGFSPVFEMVSRAVPTELTVEVE